MFGRFLHGMGSRAAFRAFGQAHRLDDAVEGAGVFIDQRRGVFIFALFRPFGKFLPAVVPHPAVRRQVGTIVPSAAPRAPT